MSAAAGDQSVDITVIERQRRRNDETGWSATLNPTDGAGWVFPSGLPASPLDRVSPASGWEWSSDWTIDRGGGADADGWRYGARFEDFSGAGAAAAPADPPSERSSAAVRQRRWRRSQCLSSSRKERQRSMNHLRMSLLARSLGPTSPQLQPPLANPWSDSGGGGGSAAASSGSGTEHPTTDEEDDEGGGGGAASGGGGGGESDDDMENSMYYSAIDRGVMALSRSIGSPSTPVAPKRSGSVMSGGGRRGSRPSSAATPVAAPLSPPVKADTVHSRPLRPEEKVWFEGASKAGMWVVKSDDGQMLCAYTRGKDVAVRYRPEEVYEGARVADVACGPRRHVWVITAAGELFASVSSDDDETAAPDAPDTVTVTTYENERWWVSPRGWSSNMLPSDRPPWSDETGLVAQPRESFQLPSARWSWTNNWELITGPHTDAEGWQYAKDFTKAYSPVARFSDAVRRRTWTRERRVIKSVPWVKCSTLASVVRGSAPSAVEDTRQFLPRSVAVGANAVWVLADGWTVYVRTGRLDAEDFLWADWQPVSTPRLGGAGAGGAGGAGVGALPEEFAGCVSVGPTAQTWLVSPTGEAFVRKSASVVNPVGTRWVPVKGPRLRHVCAGENLVWAVTADGDVLHRRDVSAYKPHGRLWDTVPRPSPARCVAVTASPRPEVVRVVTESGVVFSRQGVSAKAPTGTGWVPIDFGFRAAAHAVAGATPRGALMHMQPFARGPWFAAIAAQLAERDAAERRNRQFSQYHTFTDFSQVGHNKSGTLKWLRGGEWCDVHFSLSAETLSYADSTNHSSHHPQAARPDAGAGSKGAGVARAPSAEMLPVSQLVAVQGGFHGGGGGGGAGDAGADAAEQPLSARQQQQQQDQPQQQLRFRVEFETRTLLLAAESERDKEGWIMSLLTTHAAAPCLKSCDKVAVSLGFRAPESTAIWALDDDGSPWYCRRPSLDDKGGHYLIWYSVKPYLLDTSWGCALGRFVGITATGGITWALGENGKIYLSNHAKYESSTEERYKVINRRMGDGWTEVPRTLDDGATDIGGVTTVSLGRGCAWATTAGGKLFVRTGVSRQRPQGDRWEPITQAYPVSAVRVCGPNVWGLVAGGNVVFRRGFSGDSPHGTHWELCNGLVLSPFHLEGSPAIDPPADQPGAAVAVPPSRDPCDVTATDVAGTQKRRYVVDPQHRVMRGDEVRYGVVEWTVELEGATQVCEGDGGLLWAVGTDGGVRIKSADSSRREDEWNSLRSISAYEPTRTLHWSCIGPSADSSSVAASSAHRRGDGQDVHRDRTLWGERYRGMLRDRKAAVVAFLERSEGVLWQPFVREPIIGSKAIAYYPATDFWYNCRCVSGKMFEHKYCYLIGFLNSVHMWAYAGNMIYNEAPREGVIYQGLELLFSSPDEDGKERFARGCVAESLPGGTFVVRSLRDDDNGATCELPLDRLRLLPRLEPPDLGDVWLKRLSLARKQSGSRV